MAEGGSFPGTYAGSTFAASNPIAKIERAQRMATGMPDLSFPMKDADLYNTHHIIFRVFELKRHARNDPDKKKSISTITLPMTQELAVQYNAQYSTPDLGPLGKMIEDSGSAIAEAFEAGSAAFNSSKSEGFIKKMADATSAGGSTLDIGKMVGGFGAGAANFLMSGLPGALGAAGEGATAAVQNTFGAARNPHKAVLFGGTDFRSHSFSFRFSPVEQRESERIKQIINVFKWHMHPGFAKGKMLGADLGAGNHFFTIPEFFEIELSNKGKYTVSDYQPCVLKGITVNYHPSNYPAYARAARGGDPAPMEVVMNLDFQEIDIISKDVIGDPYGGQTPTNEFPSTTGAGINDGST